MLLLLDLVLFGSVLLGAPLVSAGNCVAPLDASFDYPFPGMVVDVIADDDDSETTGVSFGRTNGVVDTLCLPMRSMSIRAVVVDGIVEVAMTQEFDTYISSSFPWPSSPTHSRYQLPLDEQAAVTAFRADIGDRTIEGVVKETAQAQQDFQDALESGQSAFLAEQSRPDIFILSCGNLPPNQLVRVTLVYVAPLAVLGGDRYRFVLPTKIAPRYEPRSATDTAIEPLPELWNSGVQITLGCVLSTPMNITSRTHEIRVEEPFLSTVVNVEVTNSDPLERDVVIDFQASSLSGDPQIFMEQSSEEEESSAFLLSWVPQLGDSNDEGGADKEFVFILDRSGSMSGVKISQLRQALRILLDGLHPLSLFNFVGFGDSFAYLFQDGSQPRSDETIYGLAIDYIDSLQADLGGTNILEPIESVLTAPSISTHQRIVFLITDGQVSNENEVINFVGDHLGSSRVFTLGLGENPARTLLNGIARNGAGTSDYVNGDSYAAILEAVQRQMAIATDTAGLAIETIDWGGTEGSRAPFETPRIFSGRRFLQYFLSNKNNSVAGDVVIQTDSNNEGSGEYRIAPSSFVQIRSLVQTDVVHKMAARELIRDLEEGRSYLHAEGEPSDEAVKAEIVRIGVKYQIVSSETSFIAVDNQGWTGGTKDAPEFYGRGDTASTNVYSAAMTTTAWHKAWWWWFSCVVVCLIWMLGN